MARGTGYWAVGTKIAGGVGEKTKVWIDGARAERRANRKERAALQKQKQNDHATLKELARLINANFTAGDLLLGLDYSEQAHRKLDCAAGIPDGLDKDALAAARVEHMDAIRQAAEHQLALCIRRVSRLLKKDGMELYYISVTSDMDGDTGEHVRVHHHLIVPKGAERAFLAKWEKLGYGGVSWSPLWEDQIDRTPIAVYLLRQVRRIPDGNKYTSSRNLVRPREKRRAVATDALLRVPKGCSILHINEYQPGQAQYMKYLLPPEQVEAAEEAKRRRRAEKGFDAE